jgi:hypothetical protein
MSSSDAKLKVFPATELPSYGEPVSPDEMQAWRVYFALQYLDRDLLVPRLYPLIFLGHDLDGGRRNMRFFQDFDSYRARVRYANKDEEVRRFTQAAARIQVSPDCTGPYRA